MLLRQACGPGPRVGPAVFPQAPFCVYWAHEEDRVRLRTGRRAGGPCPGDDRDALRTAFFRRHEAVPGWLVQAGDPGFAVALADLAGVFGDIPRGLSRFDQGYGKSAHGRNGWAWTHYGSPGATRVSGIEAEPVVGRWSPLEPRGATCVTRHLDCTVSIDGPQQTDRFGALLIPTERPNLRQVRVGACSLERLLPSGTQDVIHPERLHDIRRLPPESDEAPRGRIPSPAIRKPGLRSKEHRCISASGVLPVARCGDRTLVTCFPASSTHSRTLRKNWAVTCREPSTLETSVMSFKPLEF